MNNIELLGFIFIFEHGNLFIDIMGSIMRIEYANGDQYAYDLKTNKNDHADGDLYIAHAILGNPLPTGYHMATLNDPIVKLANLLGLISEYQALHRCDAITIANDAI